MKPALGLTVRDQRRTKIIGGVEPIHNRPQLLSLNSPPLFSAWTDVEQKHVWFKIVSRFDRPWWHVFSSSRRDTGPDLSKKNFTRCVLSHII